MVPLEKDLYSHLNQGKGDSPSTDWGLNGLLNKALFGIFAIFNYLIFV